MKRKALIGRTGAVPVCSARVRNTRLRPHLDSTVGPARAFTGRPLSTGGTTRNVLTFSWEGLQAVQARLWVFDSMHSGHFVSEAIQFKPQKWPTRDLGNEGNLDYLRKIFTDFHPTWFYRTSWWALTVCR